MELSDYEEEILRFLMGDKPRAVKEEIRRFLTGNDPRAVKVNRWLMEAYHRELMEAYDRELIEAYQRDLMLVDIRKILLCCNDSHLSEEVKVACEEMSQYISEVIENHRRNQLMEKLKLFIFLLAFLLHSGNDDYKHLARPERGKINCITVYLLGNDGAHSYNGNGILLTTTRRYTRLTNEELLDEIRPANIPLHVLQRQPTDKEIARLSGKIGHEYRQLGFELGLKPAQLDHLIMDYQFTAHRIERMLLIWRDDIEGNATFEILVKAMCMHGINPEIVYQSLERA